MRKAVYLALCFAILAGASCKKKSPEPTPTPTPTPVPAAKVKFTNACLNTPSLGVKINDTALSSLSGLAFLATSAYLNVTPGTSVKTSFIFPSTNSPLVSPAPSFSFTDGSNYSVFAVGDVTSAAAMMVSDDLTAPAANKAKVRFVNLSLDALSDNFYVAGNKLDSAVMYKDVTPFHEVPSGDQNVIVQDPNDVGNQQTITPQNFVAGKIYTIMLTGSKLNTGDAALKLTVITHN